MLCIMLAPGCALADDYLVANIAASHWSRSDTQRLDLNENNPGLGLERDDGKLFLAAGFYKNSIRRTSIYTIAAYMPLQFDTLRAGIAGGLVTGYQYAIVPISGILASWQPGRIGLNILAVPNIPYLQVYGFAGIQFKAEIKP